LEKNMKKISMIRLTLRLLIFVAFLVAVASAGWSSFHGGFMRGAVSAQAIPVTVVNAASFSGDKVLAPDSIAAAFGQYVTQNNQSFVAPSVPLPTTLGGVRVKVGTADAGLFFVSPLQINFQIPAGLADTASATVTVTNSDNSTRTGTFTITRAAPGVFSAKSDGTGVAAAQSTKDGVNIQNVFNPDGTAKDLDAGTVQQPNFLILYTTGIRNTPAANPTDGNGVGESVTVKLQGVQAQVLYAGPVPGFVALDQINIRIPPEMAGLGSVRIVITANGRTSNPVTVKLGGQFPPVRVNPIALGDTKTGELTVDDQVQQDNSTGDTFFFDAYRFTTTSPNTTLAIDLRSTAFDAAVLLYRIDNGTLTFVAVDDQSGGYGNGTIDNNNALLLTVAQTPGDYVIFTSSSNVQPNGLGQYTLKLLSNVMTPLSYGQSAASPAITNTDLQTSAGTYLDVYWFNGAQGDKQQIRMTSTAFDSFLILQGNDGDPPLTADDNSGAGPQGKDSLIDPTHGDVQGLPALASLPQTGVYIIIATPFEPNKTGAYTLSLNKLAALGADASESVSPFNLSAPGRQIRDNSGREVNFGQTSFERFGVRRIVQ
jgi:uncharacterized protein (TIGR03437 family)